MSPIEEVDLSWLEMMQRYGTMEANKKQKTVALKQKTVVSWY